MIIVKPGIKRFVKACKERIFELTCPHCEAVMEVQEGELLSRRLNYTEPFVYRFSCPYCKKYHSDYSVRFLREETMDMDDVLYYDSVRNPVFETTVEELEKIRLRETRKRLGVQVEESGEKWGTDQ